MKRKNLDIKLLLLVKESNNKKFFITFIGYSALFLLILAVLSILFAPFLSEEVLGNFIPNMWIRILLWMMTVTASSSLMWQSYSELLHFPDESNEKAMWLQILSLGVFGIAFVLPMFNIDYIGEGFGQIFSHHLYYMITLGILVGYLFWYARNFKKIKEIIGEGSRII